MHKPILPIFAGVLLCFASCEKVAENRMAKMGEEFQRKLIERDARIKELQQRVSAAEARNHAPAPSIDVAALAAKLLPRLTEKLSAESAAKLDQIVSRLDAIDKALANGAKNTALPQAPISTAPAAAEPSLPRNSVNLRTSTNSKSSGKQPMRFDFPSEGNPPASTGSTTGINAGRPSSPTGRPTFPTISTRPTTPTDPRGGGASRSAPAHSPGGPRFNPPAISAKPTTPTDPRGGGASRSE
jgi:hypothetical protein